MLWKNAIVVAILFSSAYFALSSTCATRDERQKFTLIYAVCLMLLTSLFVPMPYFAGAALFIGSFLFLTWRGVPVLASALCLTAVTPQFLYQINGVLGIQTLINLSTPVLLGFAALLALIIFPKAFVRRRMTLLDWVTITFIGGLAILYSRGTPFTTTLRSLVETFTSLGGFYLVASRGRTGPPMSVLRPVLMVGVAFSAIAISESVLGWLQFTSTAELRDAVYPYLGSPYAGQRYGLLRAILTFTDSIACSIFLGISVICAIALYLAEPRNRFIWGCVIALTTLGTLATFARTGMLVVTIGFVIYLFLARRYFYAFLFAGAGGAISFVAAASETADTAGSVDYRSRILDLVPLIAKSNLIFGDNVLPYEGDMSRFAQGQGIVDLVNTYLYLFVNGGLFLVTLFMAILFLSVKQVTGLRQERKQTDTVLYRKSALAICIALYVGLIFTSPTDKNLMYLLCAAGLLRGIGVSVDTSRSRSARHYDLSSSSSA